jgi:hypothetical protein
MVALEAIACGCLLATGQARRGLGSCEQVFYAEGVPGWDDAIEREVLRAWLATVPEADRTPWAAFCLGAARYRLLKDAATRDQQATIVELRQRIQHLERRLSWLEPDASRWLAELTRARARIDQLARELAQHGLDVPGGLDGQPTPAKADQERVLPDLR